ncbi:MAG: adenylosuccinate synthase [Phycisphaerales bacterium]|nr:adenylosuccinate synthase [Phycisphaerales bacterium]
MPQTVPSPRPARPLSAATQPATAVFGLQWGDEGKGKAVDLLAREHDAVVRYNGGANAGHSVVVGGTRYSLHLIPSGILYPGRKAIIGNGVVVDPEALLKEVDDLTARGVDVGGLMLSSRAHIVMPYHKAEDAFREERLARESRSAAGTGLAQLGTTRRGIGPAYADKVQRSVAIRAADLRKPDVLSERVRLACELKRHMAAGSATPEAFNPDQVIAGALAAGRRLAPMIHDTTYELDELLRSGRRVLFEGANGTLLDVDHGTYPYVTSSSCGSAGIASGAGVPAQRVGRLLGVMKAYSTRVGTGPMPTELHDDTAHRIRERGREYGTTTGRPRRVGWLDLVAVRYAAMINGATGLAITLLDVLAGFEELKVCTAYRAGGAESDRFTPDALDLSRAEPVYRTLPGFRDEVGHVRRRADLPGPARGYIDFIEDFVGVPAELISVGPDREQTILE